jgi:tetratricopeptide (TPR) repeat protein
MRQRLQALFGLLGFFLLAAAGCTHSVGRGSDLYYQGRYIEAAHVLEMSEPRLRSADEQERAVYGLYRGATLFRLGDLDEARRWLEYTEQLSASRPEMLRGEQHELLQETMIALRADLDRRAAARGF